MVLLEYSLIPKRTVWPQGNILEKLTYYCQSQAPYEACGILYGSCPSPEAVWVDGFDGIPNISSTPQVHFELDPEVWIPLVLAPASKIVGIFHSHPQSPAYPSVEDLEIPWVFPTYWIISLLPYENHPIRCYSLEGQDRWEEQLVKRNNG